jgi:protein disulfide-isomerase
MPGLRACSLIVLSLVAPVAAFAQEAGIAWRADVAAAQAEAQRTGKLVLLHFWTESCGPCKLLEKRVFTQPGVASAVEANYVPVKVNANEAPQLVEAYGITKVPTDVVVTPQGDLVKSFVSPATPMAYVAVTNELASTVRDRSGAPFQAMANASPYGAAAAAASSTAQQFGVKPEASYEQFKNANLGAPQSTLPTPSAAVAGVAGAVGARYAMAAPTAVMQPAASPAMSPAPVASGVTEAAPVNTNPYASQSTPEESVAATPPSVSPQPTAQTAAPQVAQTGVPQLPAGSPPLGFDGYCPVSMKNDWKWVRGDVRWGAIHLGRTYLFASEGARDAFLATPDQFSPALSGSDPVLAVESKQSVAGTREYALEYRGKFYFFASEQTLNKFWTNADGYAQGAERIAATAGETVIR